MLKQHCRHEAPIQRAHSHVLLCVYYVIAGRLSHIVVHNKLAEPDHDLYVFSCATLQTLNSNGAL